MGLTVPPVGRNQVGGQPVASRARSAFDLVRHYPDATVLLAGDDEIVVAGPWYDHLAQLCADMGWPTSFRTVHAGVMSTWTKADLVVTVQDAADGVLSELVLARVYGFRAETGKNVLLLPL